MTPQSSLGKLKCRIQNATSLLFNLTLTEHKVEYCGEKKWFCEVTNFLLQRSMGEHSPRFLRNFTSPLFFPLARAPSGSPLQITNMFDFFRESLLPLTSLLHLSEFVEKPVFFRGQVSLDISWRLPEEILTPNTAPYGNSELPDLCCS